MACRFLALPPELRNHIYECVYADFNHLPTLDGGLPSDGLSEPQSPPGTVSLFDIPYARPQPDICLVNRQFYSETLPHYNQATKAFYLAAVFPIDVNHANESDFSAILTRCRTVFSGRALGHVLIQAFEGSGSEFEAADSQTSSYHVLTTGHVRVKFEIRQRGKVIHSREYSRPGDVWEEQNGTPFDVGELVRTSRLSWKGYRSHFPRQ